MMMMMVIPSTATTTRAHIILAISVIRQSRSIRAATIATATLTTKAKRVGVCTDVNFVLYILDYIVFLANI